LLSRLRSETAADPEYRAQFLTALGDTDGALDAIQAWVTAERSGSLMTYCAWDALFSQNLAPLRQNPRVPQLLARWGLLDYWRQSGKWPDFCGEPGLAFDCKAAAGKKTSPSHS